MTKFPDSKLLAIHFDASFTGLEFGLLDESTVQVHNKYKYKVFDTVLIGGKINAWKFQFICIEFVSYVP